MSVDVVALNKLLDAASHIETSDLQSDTTGAGRPEYAMRSAILLPSALDARWYVMHSDSVLRGDSPRIRDTDRDNAPLGREVHWSSLLIWLGAGLAWVLGLPPNAGGALAQVEQTPYLLGPLLFLPGALLVLLMAGKRYGWPVAGFLVLALATAFPFYDMFRAGETDHHGMAGILAVASVLALAAGHGAARPRHWFVLSGLCGAAGLWVSASTLIPVIAACGLGAALGIIATRARGAGQAVARHPWRAWGGAGLAGSVFFYLLEYFPAHMGSRLEVNNPLHGLAWLASAHLLSRFECWMRGTTTLRQEVTGGHFAIILACLSAIALPPVLIRVFKENVFAVADPFLLALHSEFIREFAPAWVSHGSGGIFSLLSDVLWWPVFVMAGLVVMVRRQDALDAEWVQTLCIASTAAVFIQVQALLQVRWTGLAIGMWILTAVLLASAWLANRSRMRLPWPAVAVFAAWAVLGISGFPAHSLRTIAHLKANPEVFPKNMVPTILLRDLAHRIAQASPDGKAIVLSDPTSSTDLAYYGGLRVLGTLYWENLQGLKRAARIFSAPDEASVRTLMEEAGITHIVVPSWDSFADFSAYERLLEKSGEAWGHEGASYLAGVVTGRHWPDWLRRIHYPIPAAFGVGGSRIAVFEVVPGQSRFDALKSRAIYHAEAGEIRRSLHVLEEARRLKPGDPELTEWIEGLRRIDRRRLTPAPEAAKVP